VRGCKEVLRGRRQHHTEEGEEGEEGEDKEEG